MNTDIKNKEREFLAIKASIIGVIGNTFLAIIKFLIGVITGSLAITADAIDSATDVITSIMTYIAAKISNKPADENHPYGHEKAETIITKLLSLVIIYAGFEVLTRAISNLLSGDIDITNLNYILLISFISLLIKYFLYKYKLIIGKKIVSASSIADAYNMKNDIFTSASIFIGILIFYFTGIKQIDSILAIFVSFFIFKVGISMFLETSNELMDGSNELGEIYNEIVKIVDQYSEIKNPHKIRVRKSSFVYFIDMHVEVDENMTVKKANSLSFIIEKDIKNSNYRIKDITIHFEPFGNKEKEEFGHNKESIEKTFKN